MVRLSLMASQVYLPGLVFHPEQGMCRVSKDCQPLLPSPESRQDVMRSCPLNMRPHHSEQPWRPTSGLLDGNPFVRIDSPIRKRVLIDVQDTSPNSILFSFGISEHCTRRRAILKFLMSGSSEVESGGLDLPILSDLMGIKAETVDNPQQPYVPDYGLCFHDAESRPTIFYPSCDPYSRKPLLELVRNLGYMPEVAGHLDGRVSFTGVGAEMKHILSIIAEFYLSETSAKWRKKSVLVPQFNRLELDSSEAKTNIQESSLKLETVKFAPLKSPEKIKLKPSLKKKSNRKAGKERDLYRKNYSHTCESLLSIMFDKKRNAKTTIYALKKSGPELPRLLTQFSASIAGTGLALLFSIVCKVTSGRVPFCASKLLNTGLGLGLVWLSWAVNRLGDTIVHISKNSGKLSLKEEEMMKNLDRSVNAIYSRAAAVLAVVVLRLA